MPASAASASSSSAPRYVVIACNGKAVTKPAGFTPYCADDGADLEHMHWTSWTSHPASGYGTVYEDDNFPNHAAFS
jgi:hypothetical protein